MDGLVLSTPKSYINNYSKRRKNMSNNGGRQELQKSLNMKDVLALAFGTMIG